MHEKLQILKEVLGQYRISNQEHLFHCPYCDHHKRKFSINVEKNVYKCWVCDTRGLDVYQVVRKFGTPSNVQKWRVLSNKVEINGFENIFKEPEKIKEDRVHLPKEFVSLANDVPISARNAMNYLRRRGVGKEDIVRWKIGFCPYGDYGDRIVIPSFGMSGYANFFEARTYRNDWMKYKKPQASKDIIFNELYVDWGRDLILVEGVFDAIRAHSVGMPIPLLGSTVRVESKLFQKIVMYDPKVYVALDSDADYKASKIAQSLMNYDIEVYSINTEGYEDVAEMPKDVLAGRKATAVRMSTDNFLLEKIRGT